jgi:hypothetical protein
MEIETMKSLAKGCVRIILAACVLAGIAGRAEGGKKQGHVVLQRIEPSLYVYTTDENNNWTYYQIDPISGLVAPRPNAFTLPHDGGYDSIHKVRYSVQPAHLDVYLFGLYQLWMTDERTGQSTLIGETGLSGGWDLGLAYDARSGSLYGAGGAEDGDGWYGWLWRIDVKTAQPTSIADLGGQLGYLGCINSIAFSPKDGYLYGLPLQQVANTVVKINPLTGEAQLLTGAGVNFLYDAIVVDPVSGYLYVTTYWDPAENDGLRLFNPLTGELIRHVTVPRPFIEFRAYKYLFFAPFERP